MILRPPDVILEPLQMSIHTHQVKLSNMCINYEDLFHKLAPTLDDAPNVFALHCNKGHAVKLRYQDDDSLWKRIPTELELAQKNRKVNGDGSCFQACVEVYVRVKHPEISPLKNYKIKVFSSTGSVQTPGGRLNSNEDVDIALSHLIAYLNANDVGRDADGASAPVARIVQNTAMKNYRSRLNLDDPQLDLFNYRLSWYIQHIQDDELDELEGVYVKPPFRIIQAENADEGSKTSFCFLVGTSEDGKEDSFRVEVFNNEKKIKIGKINFKGVKNEEYAVKAYKWLEDIFRANWHVFVGPRAKVDARAKTAKNTGRRKNLLESLADLPGKKESASAEGKPLAKRKTPKVRTSRVPKPKAKAPAKEIMRAVQRTPKLEAAPAPGSALDRIDVDFSLAEQSTEASLEALLKDISVEDELDF